MTGGLEGSKGSRLVIQVQSPDEAHRVIRAAKQASWEIVSVGGGRQDRRAARRRSSRTECVDEGQERGEARPDWPLQKMGWRIPGDLADPRPVSEVDGF